MRKIFSQMDDECKDIANQIQEATNKFKKKMSKAQDEEELDELYNQSKEETQMILDSFINHKKTFALCFKGKVIGSIGIEEYNEENYPELKASEQFLKLQKSLVKVESQLQAARRIYNNDVTKSNTKISTFCNSSITSSILLFALLNWLFKSLNNSETLTKATFLLCCLII